ncbi:hypothetical protein HHK36_029706 [Tetracentron sinense]|uniref:glutathione transferase n=1 Tax=Tetracentron sinense TaxID=13715 RepID=A0A835CZK8_TETSI|nr:hypothetical protein HHK36_029706 [Tetracentron sinense]
MLEEAFEKCSKGKGYFGGEKIGYIDIALGSFLGWIRVTEKMVGLKLINEAKTPSLVGWVERFCEDSAVKELFPSIHDIAEGQLEGEAKEAAIEQMSEGLIFLEDAFQKCSKGKGCFGGEKIGYLDIALGCFLGWIKVTEKMVGMELIDKAKTPSLVGWVERFCVDSSVKEVMPEIEKLEEFAKLIQAMLKASPK